MVKGHGSSKFDWPAGYPQALGRNTIMQTNFQFRDSIYLVFDNYELDLHNDYDFIRIEYSIVERTAELHWRRSNRDWVKPNLPTAITIRFGDVSKFEFKPRDSNLPFTEDDCLGSVGYIANEDWCDGIFGTEGAPEDGWMQAFEFMSGAIIALRANTSSVTIKP